MIFRRTGRASPPSLFNPNLCNATAGSRSAGKGKCDRRPWRDQGAAGQDDEEVPARSGARHRQEGAAYSQSDPRARKKLAFGRQRTSVAHLAIRAGRKSPQVPRTLCPSSCPEPDVIRYNQVQGGTCPQGRVFAIWLHLVTAITYSHPQPSGFENPGPRKRSGGRIPEYSCPPTGPRRNFVRDRQGHRILLLPE